MTDIATTSRDLDALQLRRKTTIWTVVGALGPLLVPDHRHEEIAPRAIFEAEYGAHRKRVPRFLPRLSQWQDAPILMIDPKHYRQTALDA
ncbi:hypothetical protein [Aurantimonas sp. VKM B-3413]|uniref:hypothetical protein n=1 Tax=Aurantimonas sp. VKM B-3413 TaxID=2779401 RepID=UPI001E6004E0|nr:hypothetical protein [Aurantimonas sp. VKM B-3413]MCB8836696.1 hypothetical protein [Aurantimonas sp. VKM B-3413]